MTTIATYQENKYNDDNYYSNVDNRRFSFMFMDSFAMQSGLKIGYLF